MTTTETVLRARIDELRAKIKKDRIYNLDKEQRLVSLVWSVLQEVSAPYAQDITSAMHEHKNRMDATTTDTAQSILTRIADALIAAVPDKELEFTASTNKNSREAWEVLHNGYFAELILHKHGDLRVYPGNIMVTEGNAVETLLDILGLDTHHEPVWLDTVPEGYTGPLWVRDSEGVKLVLCRHGWTIDGGVPIMTRTEINSTDDITVQIPIRPA